MPIRDMDSRRREFPGCHLSVWPVNSQSADFPNSWLIAKVQLHLCSGLAARYLLALPGQQPFNIFPKFLTDSKQELRPNLQFAAFHGGEIVLADANAFGASTRLKNVWNVGFENVIWPGATRSTSLPVPQSLFRSRWTLMS